MRNIEQDVDRILRKWFHEVPPSRMLFSILKENSVFVESRDPVVACTTWISQRIYRTTGRPPQDKEFVRGWVRAFFLPSRLLEKHPSFLQLQSMAIRCEFNGWDKEVSKLVERFECGEDLVNEALNIRGLRKDQLHPKILQFSTR